MRVANAGRGGLFGAAVVPTVAVLGEEVVTACSQTILTTVLRTASSPSKSLIWTAGADIHSFGSGSHWNRAPTSTKTTLKPCEIAFLQARSAGLPGAVPFEGSPSVRTSRVFTASLRPGSFMASSRPRCKFVLLPIFPVGPTPAGAPRGAMFFLASRAFILSSSRLEYLNARVANCTPPRLMPSFEMGKSPVI